MKSRYKYSIFFLLGVSVFGMMYLSYQYIDSPQMSISDAETSDMDDTTNMFNHQYTKNSWLGQLKKDINQKSYFYAVSEIQLELN